MVLDSLLDSGKILFGLLLAKFSCNWEVYVVNQQNSSIAQLWMEQASLKRTFRRRVNEKLMRKWEGVVQLASTIVFTREEGRIIYLAI